MSESIYTNECLVPGKKNRIGILKVVAGALGAAVCLFFTLSLASMLLALLAIACIFFAVLSFETIFREFEYTIGESALTVDAIYSKKRRKQQASFPIDTICLFAPEGTDELAHWQRQSGSVRDYSSSAPGAERYYCVCRQNGKVTVSVLSPSASFLSALKQSLPRSVLVIKK